jgi:hypothetical protein
MDYTWSVSAKLLIAVTDGLLMAIAYDLIVLDRRFTVV